MLASHRHPVNIQPPAAEERDGEPKYSQMGTSPNGILRNDPLELKTASATCLPDELLIGSLCQ